MKYLFSPHSTQSPHFLQKFTAFTAFLTKIYPKTPNRDSTTHINIICLEHRRTLIIWISSARIHTKYTSKSKNQYYCLLDLLHLYLLLLSKIIAGVLKCDLYDSFVFFKKQKALANENCWVLWNNMFEFRKIE